MPRARTRLDPDIVEADIEAQAASLERDERLDRLADAMRDARLRLEHLSFENKVA